MITILPSNAQYSRFKNHFYSQRKATNKANSFSLSNQRQLKMCSSSHVHKGVQLEEAEKLKKVKESFIELLQEGADGQDVGLKIETIDGLSAFANALIGTEYGHISMPLQFYEENMATAVTPEAINAAEAAYSHLLKIKTFLSENPELQVSIILTSKNQEHLKTLEDVYEKLEAYSG